MRDNVRYVKRLSADNLWLLAIFRTIFWLIDRGGRGLPALNNFGYPLPHTKKENGQIGKHPSHNKKVCSSQQQELESAHERTLDGRPHHGHEKDGVRS